MAEDIGTFSRWLNGGYCLYKHCWDVLRALSSTPTGPHKHPIFGVFSVGLSLGVGSIFTIHWDKVQEQQDLVVCCWFSLSFLPAAAPSLL